MIGAFEINRSEGLVPKAASPAAVKSALEDICSLDIHSSVPFPPD